ncbi:MAG: PAS domain S-box protein [Deltaproteobacteria bacterium]|nr:PAS domain S-box protein [Deltaproteobacteria bacterium]
MATIASADEQGRLDRLRSYAAFGAPLDHGLANLTDLVAYVCRTPIALLNFVEEDRVWVRAGRGLDLTEAPRDAMMCPHTIRDRGPLIVPDLSADPRFASTRFVAGDPHVRFYAGAPLVTGDGYAIGTLCVLDYEPRALDEAQIGALVTLAVHAMAWLDLQRTTATLQTVIDQCADGIVIVDEHGNVEMNAAAIHQLGADGQRCVGALPVGMTVDGEALRPAEAPVQRALRGELIRDYRWQLPRPGGGRLVLSVSAAPLHRHDLRRGGAVLILRDQTERSRLEQEVEESRDEVRVLLESTGEGIYGIGPDGRCTFVNPAAVRMLGYDRAGELLGRYMHDVVHHTTRDGQHIARSECRLHDTRSPGVHVLDDVLRRRDGSVLPVEIWSSPVLRRGRHVGCVVTFVDVSERKRVEHERERALNEAQEALHARDEFLSIAAHELRTPVTALQLQTQSIMRQARVRDSLPPPVATRLDLVLRQGERLEKLINQLLDVSRIATHRLELETEDIDLVALVREVVTRYEPQARSAGCALSLDAPAELRGCWDRSRLEQVVTNLLSNATKYGRGRPVEVSVREEAGDREVAVLTVRDHGIGISLEDQTRIFERFERATYGRDYAGLGLGLYIARQIVEASGGRIEVQSETGQGSAFRVVLPRACGSKIPGPT